MFVIASQVFTAPIFVFGGVCLRILFGLDDLVNDTDLVGGLVVLMELSVDLVTESGGSCVLKVDLGVIVVEVVAGGGLVSRGKGELFRD